MNLVVEKDFDHECKRVKFRIRDVDGYPILYEFEMTIAEIKELLEALE